MFTCCLVTVLCYLSIHSGLRRHVAQIHQRRNVGKSANFNVLQYKKTVNDILWIFGLRLVCYIPYLSTLFAILALGLITLLVLHYILVLL